MTSWLVLAHQGGWDELLVVAAPMAVFGGLLLLANRRAKRHGRRDQTPTSSSS